MKIRLERNEEKFTVTDKHHKKGFFGEKVIETHRDMSYHEVIIHHELTEVEKAAIAQGTIAQVVLAELDADQYPAQSGRETYDDPVRQAVADGSREVGKAYLSQTITPLRFVSKSRKDNPIRILFKTRKEADAFEMKLKSSVFPQLKKLIEQSSNIPTGSEFEL